LITARSVTLVVPTQVAAGSLTEGGRLATPNVLLRPVCPSASWARKDTLAPAARAATFPRQAPLVNLPVTTGVTGIDSLRWSLMLGMETDLSAPGVVPDQVSGSPSLLFEKTKRLLDALVEVDKTAPEVVELLLLKLKSTIKFRTPSSWKGVVKLKVTGPVAVMVWLDW
jgi:hypothetical protein